MTITEFLLARIAEDEEAVGVFPARNWHNDYGDVRDDSGSGFDSIVLEVGYEGCCQTGIAEHVARYDPARVLAECAAKRAIIERIPKLSDEYRPDWFTGSSALYVLAAIYADHPDYDPDWAL